MMRPLQLLAVLGVLLFSTRLAGAEVVINEVDYDQPGTDTSEFIELLNNGPASALLSEYTVELVNGSGGGAAIYNVIQLPTLMMGPGECLVLCAGTVPVANCSMT